MKWALVAGAVVAAGVGAALAWPAGEAPRGIETVRVARRTIGANVKATGVLKPMVGAEVRVGSRVSGVVKRLHVRIGDAVAKGQLLAELDAVDLAARRDQAAAAFESARAGLRYAAANLGRNAPLAEEQLIAPGDLELLQRARDVAEAQVAEAQANLAAADIQLGWARITAPIDGVVASISTQEGETVAASFAAPTFVTLIDVTRLEVRAYVDETDIGRIRAGQSASFTVDTYPDAAFDGAVTTIYPQAEIRDNVVNYVAVVTFAPPAGRTLRPEMTAMVRIALEKREAVLTLPRRAVRREAGKTFVRVPGGRRWVTTGARGDDIVEVTGGVSEGDEVVVGEVQE
jgi:macrolide-specific efflux system membrane fusion protein